MNVYQHLSKEEWLPLLKRPVFSLDTLYDKVQSVLSEIRISGDHAVEKYTRVFDGIDLDAFHVPEEALNSAGDALTEALKEAIQRAAENIRLFHMAQQLPVQKVETRPGVTCWQKSMPIEKVGLYVPGGTAPLFSSVLMLGIPAQIAGCKQIVLCTPPNKEGQVHPAILYAASLVGGIDVYTVGGVQAIGAMAYGTQTIPAVYKIFGPGNQYVMAAKQIVSRHDVAIDMPAGPSEVAVMVDDSSNPDYAAADLLSQAEHGPDSQVILVAPSHRIVDMINQSLARQLKELPRRELAMQSLDHSKAFVMRDLDEMLDLINHYAPEHLIISMHDAEHVAEKISNAGSVFIGNFTPESAGDYASGTNHTLPTNGWARSYSGVNLDAFVRKITFQQITREGLRHIGSDIELMARAEELEAHAYAVSVRLAETSNQSGRA